MYKVLIIFLSLFCSIISAEEFTIGSYNCGALSSHYDYLRAVAMQKLMQERYTAEPENMALLDRIQALALKILFAKNPEEKKSAQKEWDQKSYDKLLKNLIKIPTDSQSPNQIWNKKSEEMITTYHVRPVTIYDEEIREMLEEHLGDLTDVSDLSALTEARGIMAKRIFKHYLKFDIICLQEADYLKSSFFPENYKVVFSNTAHSRNGVAWNTNRFELVEDLGNILGRGYIVKLLDKETKKTLLVASGHISGCNPFQVENNDSAKGDRELQTIVDVFDNEEADLRLIGMDSNVTAVHPRLQILKNSGYLLDYENFLHPTCTNPYQVLNTRIDWIAVKSDDSVTINNIPVLSVGLNNLQTNLSDHKPIAAQVKY